MAKVLVSSSSLPAGRNMSSQLEYIKRVQNYGADMYHIDVMDGKFVKNETIDYNYLEQLRENSVLLFDVHLMVSEPKKSLIKKYINLGANILTVHYEAFEDKEDLKDILKFIKNKGCMVGIAFDVDTELQHILAYLNMVDMVTILSVKVGRGGQTFNEKALSKVKEIRKVDSKVLIEIDGGINAITAPKCIKAGVDILAVGSFIYENDTYEAIQCLKGKV